MGLRENGFAKVWTAKPNGKIYSGRVSVSKKDKKTGKYKDPEFSDYVNFAGAAAEKIAELGLPEKSEEKNPTFKNIKILSAEISTWYDRDSIKRLIDDVQKKVKDEGLKSDLTRFIKARANIKNVTIWDFELSEYNSNGTAESKPTTAKTNTVVSDDEEELPF